MRSREQIRSRRDTIARSSDGAFKEISADSLVTILQLDSTPEPGPADLESVLDVVKEHFGTTPSIVDGAEACISAICSLLAPSLPRLVRQVECQEFAGNA